MATIQRASFGLSATDTKQKASNTTGKPSGRYYYVQNKDGAWKSAEDFSAFLAKHNFRFKDYPGGKKLPEFLGFKSYSDYVKAKSHDWSNAYVSYDIDAEQKKLLGYVV